MSSPEINVYVCRRPDKSVSIERRHAEVMERMAQVGPPLGFSGLELPPAPDCGNELVAVYGVKLSVRGLKFLGYYTYRGEKYQYKDQTSFDDRLRYGFKSSNKFIDYRSVLHESLPRVIEAYDAYRAFVSYDYYDLHYSKGGNHGVDKHGYPISINETYKQLLADKSIDVNGRNNIYTLRPAQYWDAELCNRALGYGPDEVVNRLQGHVLRVERLMDGVYTVLNDDFALTYEEFVAMNDRIKQILGLI